MLKPKEEDDQPQEKQRNNLAFLFMSLLETLRKDMFEAKKASNENKANILGIAISSINDFQLTTDKELNDDDIVSILRKEEKKLKDALEQYTQNGRKDLAKIEREQLEVITSYLPKLMSEEEVEKFVKEEVAQMDSQMVSQMGKVIGGIMGKLKGKADGSLVSSIVKKVLSEK